MIFKRNEGFRFAFGEPLKASFVILLNGKPLSIERPRVACEVLDISPRGMKIVTDIDLNDYRGFLVQLELHFLLDMVQMKALGEVVWAKKLGSKYQYGIYFNKQSALEDLIIDELKARRKREIAAARLNRYL